MTTVVSRGAEARAEALGARAERLSNARGVAALQALHAGAVDVAAEVERGWP